MSEHSKYQVRSVFDEALNLFENKNADYGDSWRNHGWRGNLGRILEKADRLQTTLWHGGPVGFAIPDEGARQTAIDMMNTLAFFVINWDGRREWGHESPPAPEVRYHDDTHLGNGSTFVEMTAEEVRQIITSPSPEPRPLRDHSTPEPPLYTHEP